MEEITEKLAFEDIDFTALPTLAHLLRRTECAQDGDVFKFQGRVFVTHLCSRYLHHCARCCFSSVDELCCFVSCLPEERTSNSYAWFTIKSSRKEESHE